ncbi:MAG: hypothetical protein Kow00129_05200 [Thermoleophilia bacterium]
MPRVAVYVTPKQGILDPQGATVERALPALGFEGVKDIRVGRYITLEVEGQEGESLRETVDAMCRRLLANPIIEDYCFEIEGETEWAFSPERGEEEVIVGEDVPVHQAGEHAGSPWTAADPYAAGRTQVEKENEA